VVDGTALCCRQLVNWLRLHVKCCANDVHMLRTSLLSLVLDLQYRSDGPRASSQVAAEA